MELKRLFLILFLIAVSTSYSQSNNAKSVPSSIYKFSTNFDASFSNYNYGLLKHYNFVMLNAYDIENGYFSISFKNIGKKPSTLIFESYKEIYLNSFIKNSRTNEFDIVNKFSFAQ